MLSVCQGVNIIFYLRSLPLLMGKDSHYDNGGRVIYLVLIWNDSPLCQLYPQPHLHPLLMQWEDDNGKHRQSKDVKAKNTGLQKPLLLHVLYYFYLFLFKLFACLHQEKLAYMFASKIMFLVCIHQRKYFICVYLLQLWNCIHIFACKSGSNIILYFTVWMYHLFSYTRSQFAFHVYYLPAEFVNVCLCPSACFYQIYNAVYSCSTI